MQDPRLLRQWFECFPWGNFFIRCFMEHLPRLQGLTEFTFEIFLDMGCGAMDRWHDPSCCTRASRNFQELFQMVLVLLVDISLDWHRSNTNQLLRIIHKNYHISKATSQLKHNPSPQGKRNSVGAHLERSQSRVWLGLVPRFCARFMEFFRQCFWWWGEIQAAFRCRWRVIAMHPCKPLTLTLVLPHSLRWKAGAEFGTHLKLGNLCWVWCIVGGSRKLSDCTGG